MRRCELVCKAWQSHIWESLDHLDVTALCSRGDGRTAVLKKAGLQPASADCSHANHWVQLFSQSKIKSTITSNVAAFSTLTDNKLAWSLTPGLQILQLQGNQITKASVALICRATPNLRGLNLLDCKSIILDSDIYGELAESSRLTALLLPSLEPGALRVIFHCRLWGLSPL